MAASNGAAISRQMRLVWEAGAIRDLSDGQLLDLFHAGRADRREIAFTALVERHGPMVRAVARGILGSRPDADDAFQATFLVLARKAADLAGRDMVGPWLFQVARRTAMAARRAEARRRRLDQKVDRPPPATVPDPEVVAIVHEEVARLPDRDRAVVVLCDLEGESLDQAARMLGCPVGTVKSRLSRARDRLGRGLRRRGLDGSQMMPLGMAPALPITLVNIATTAAIRFAAWSPLATSVAHLARGVIRTMSIKQGFASATTCLGVAMVIVVGSAWLRAGEPVPQDPRSVAKTGSPAREKPLIETAIARPDLANRVITEEASIDTSAGVGVFVDAPFATKVKSQLVPFGKRVKKDDVLFELDTARIEVTLKQIDERWELIKSSRSRGRGSNPSVKAETAEETETRSSSPHPQIAAAQNTFDRAEAKAKRYREATTNAKALAISPSDPAMLPAIAAKLSLIDRLDEAEVDLDRRRRELETTRQMYSNAAVASREGPPGAARPDDRASISRSVEKSRKHYEDALARATVRSPADGVLTPAKGFEEPMMPGKVLTAGDRLAEILPFENHELVVRVMPTSNPKSPLRNLEPGTLVLLKGTRTKDGRVRDRTTVAAHAMASPTGDSTVTHLRLEAPLEAGVMIESVEYSFQSPTGRVLVPRRAVTPDNRVAVKGPNGRFRWRKIHVEAIMNTDMVVEELLGEGEVVALDPYAAMGETPPKPAEPPVGVKAP